MGSPLLCLPVLSCFFFQAEDGIRDVAVTGVQTCFFQAEDGIRDVAVTGVQTFFFQAEDGIRDVAVTGVQTCALPIWREEKRKRREETTRKETRRGKRIEESNRDILWNISKSNSPVLGRFPSTLQIGRASCRERV